MKEPWCLVASERTVAARTLIRYYAKRCGIETSFRDIKDLRFGLGLSAIHVSKPERRDRLLLLSALAIDLAIALLSLLGAAGESLWATTAGSTPTRRSDAPIRCFARV